MKYLVLILMLKENPLLIKQFLGIGIIKAIELRSKETQDPPAPGGSVPLVVATAITSVV